MITKESLRSLVTQNLKALGGALMLVVLGAALAWGYWSWADSGVQQPIAFPHKTHIALGFTCTTCHQRAEKDRVAGRPPTELCMGCHGAGETKSAEIKKIRSYGEKGQQIPWKRVWRLPRYVFFPHQVHVTGAKLKCQTCHGPMETLTRPPAKPLKTLGMNDCISCHDKQRSVRNAQGKGAQAAKAARLGPADCTVCHR